MARVMEIATPLGADVLLFHRMHATDEMSRLCEYEIDLLSKKGDIDLDQILAKNVTVKLELPERGTRFFNGFVTRFVQVGMHGRYHLYRAIVRPWLWFLTRTANCRIFQEMSVPDIVKKVFDNYPIADFKLELTETYAKRNYCVQYRETDFNFVSRLMEDEGIYYYFKHIDGRHTMVLADSHSGHAPFEGYAQIPYIAIDRAKRLEQEFIHDWNLTREVQPGNYVLDDFDFERPGVDLQVKSKLDRNHEQAGFEIYDYPGEYVKTDEGDHYVRTRMDEWQHQFEIVSGEGNARGVSVGSLFKLTGHPRADQNREHLVLSSVYDLEYTQYESMDDTGTKCTCRFTGLDNKQQYRPPRTSYKTFVQGPQTAFVVGPAGDEIHTDKYGRVKVQFHWDREGKNDQKSSCWIRVSHLWAGKRWGAVYLPRIGQEVIVDFLEGDPDRPIITGSVYNAESMPPYALPDNATMSAIKSNSSKGGGGFNEIRMEDKKGKEQLFIHAEKNEDVRVKNDSFEWIGNERHLIVKKDQFEQVDGDKHFTLKGDLNEKVDGTVSLKAGMDLQQKVGMKHALDAGMEIHLKAGMNVVIEAGMSITLKAGGNFVVVGPAGVMISGTMVLINSGGAAGSGSGASPEAPKAPKEAANAEPGSSNKAASGSSKAAPPASKPPAGFKNPQAQTLADAARDGTPFCEKCEEAKREQTTLSTG